jgi:superfamily II DNA or RNA helicase
VAQQLNEWHASKGTGAAAAVYGEMEPRDRLDVVNAFRAGKLRYLTHFDCLTEGFDYDEVRVLVNGRPTKSQWVFAQNAGRALRPLRHVARQLGTIPDAKARRDLIAGSGNGGASGTDLCSYKCVDRLRKVLRVGHE